MNHRRAIAAATGAMLFLAAIFYFAGDDAAQAQSTANYRAGELLIKFKNETEIHRLKIDPGLDIDGVIAYYRRQPDIAYVEPNYIVIATAFPSDPKFFEQWYLTAIRAKDAWSRDLLFREGQRLTSRSVIAILDTGVDLDHPDLKINIWRNRGETIGDGIDNDRNGYVDDSAGWDFVADDNDSNPDFSPDYNADALNHGTLVAGIAAAVGNNGEGISGVSWFSDIMPLRVLDSSGSGDIFDVIEAIQYAVKNGAQVINMSFIGNEYSQSLNDAVQAAADRGVMIVAAAGNTDPEVNGTDLDVTPGFPVCYDGSAGKNAVLGVGSVDRNLKKSDFSSYGGCIDIMAPGESFYSTPVFDPSQPGFSLAYNGYWSGTSLSTPLVSGTAGLIKALRPNLDAKAIRDAILKSAKDISGVNPTLTGRLGAGQLDITKALDLALAGPTSPPPVVSSANRYLVAGLGQGAFPQIKILRQDGTVFKSFFAYSPHFTGVINVATGDVTGDGMQDVVTGAGPGGGPHVRVFTVDGQVVSQFFAYDSRTRGGVNVAVGDVNGDGTAEIITGSGPGLPPEVKIFDLHGNLLGSFLAYDQGFKGGIKVATGDINKDKVAEIVTGPGQGGGPHVRVFKFDGQLISQFFAYNQDYRGGINIAVGDLHGDGIAEIIASVEKNATPTVRVFNYLGQRLSSFIAGQPSQLYGLNLAIGDMTGDGIGDIITGPAVGGGAAIMVFNLGGTLQFDLVAHEVPGYHGGVRPSFINY